MNIENKIRMDLNWLSEALLQSVLGEPSPVLANITLSS
jgi:hypothetical protein